MEVELVSEKCQCDERNPQKCDFETKLDQSIKHIAKTEGFITYKIDKKNISTNGGNYLGELYVIDVKGKTKDGDSELNLFVKNIIETECFNVISILNAYNTELFAYKELFKKFADLQEKAKIPIEERYKTVTFYEESNAEALIFQNLANNGFKTYHRLDPMTLNFVEISIKQLAKFHALSFVLKERMPDFFDKKIKSLKYPFIFEDSWFKMCEHVKEVIFKNTNEVYWDRIEKIFESLPTKFPQYTNDDNIKVCLCHGDYRTNNIMTKINPDGNVTEIIPIDYQIIHYGSPVFDFFYLLNICTDRKFRKANLSYLKDLYYETFGRFLSYFDLDPDVMYSREEFEKVFNEKLDIGLMQAMVFLPFILVSETDVPDTNADISDLSLQVADVFKSRIEDIIEDYIEWGWL